MKNLFLLFTGLLMIPLMPSKAQDTTNLGDALVAKLNVFVFPAQGQTREQQDKDVSDCYQWAVQQSGVDPLNPPRVEAQQVEGGPDGSGVVGAAGGAAVGAAIGAIAGDAGKGAAIGAVAGGVRGRRASRAGKAQQQQSANQAAAAKEQELLNNFKKAFSACLEGKGYTVK
jgi:hypothetical protein